MAAQDWIFWHEVTPMNLKLFPKMLFLPLKRYKEKSTVFILKEKIKDLLEYYVFWGMCLLKFW